MHHVIQWDKLRRKDIIQCIRYQRLGHAVANCNLDYRCVRCKEDHKPGFCSAGKGNNHVSYCINCNNVGHPAFYRGCPKIIEIKNKIMSKLEKEKLIREKKLQHSISSIIFKYHMLMPPNLTLKSEIITIYLCPYKIAIT